MGRPDIYFADRPAVWAEYEAPLRAALQRAGIDARLTDRCEDPERVDYIVYAPDGTVEDFSPFARCRAVLSLWAGVERIVGNPTLTQPLVRMVNDGLSEGMVEYVVGHVLRHHLGMDAHIRGQDGVWRGNVAPPLARERPVAVLGLGALGATVAQALARLNFPVLGWSRTPKAVAGVDCASGEEALRDLLSRAQIVVLLLPSTPATEGLLDERRLAMLPKGAVIVNPGRGTLIDDDALLAALDAGHIAHATLDVFRREPLPPGHPFWAHPRVTVTPHVAALTRVDSACASLADNIRRSVAGLPLVGLVDRGRGY